MFLCLVLCDGNSPFCKGFEIFRVLAGLLFKGPGHEQGHQFHKETTKLKAAFRYPTSRVLFRFDKVVFLKVVHPFGIIGGMEFFGQVSLNDGFDQDHSLFAHFVVQLGFCPFLSRCSRKEGIGDQPTLPMFHVVRVIQFFDKLRPRKVHYYFGGIGHYPTNVIKYGLCLTKNVLMSQRASCATKTDCYFCPMQFLKKCVVPALCPVMTLVAFCTLSACSSFWRDDPEEKALARAGDSYLYSRDVVGLLNEDMTPQDSASFVTNYINNWAAKQLLLSKARINLPEEQLREFEHLVENYRTDLYTRAYKEALVRQNEDTTISRSELRGFYEEEKENFKLKEKLVRLRYVELPTQFLNREEVSRRLRRFNDEDREYLDSVGVQFRKLHFNDSLWVPVSRIIREIPPLTYENEASYLKKSQFFELEDSLGVYLGNVGDILKINDIAPLEFIEPTIRQVLLNRRKLDYIRKLEIDIIDEATKKKEFEVFDKP